MHMMPQPPSGQGPVDPRGAVAPPPSPPGGGGAPLPPSGWAPMPMMPPPMFYQPPPPQRGGFVRAVFVTMALAIFSVSIILNLVLLATSGLGALASNDVGTVASVVNDGDASQKVAVIPIDDVIDTPLRDRFERAIRQVEDDPSVKTLVIEVDTPGGTVTASDEIYHRIKKFKSRRNIPVVTAMGGMATSGGYYVACATDEIFVPPTTLKRDLGVIMKRFNYSSAVEQNVVAAAS